MHRRIRPICGLTFVAAVLGSANALLLGADKGPAPAPVAKGRLMRVSPSMVEVYVYQGFPNEVGCREWLNSNLKLRIDEIKNTFGISDQQAQKIELAGTGDIERFVQRVHALKDKWRSAASQAQFNAMARETWPLSLALRRGLFESGSLFEKTLLATLPPAQMAACEQSNRERESYRNQAYIELIVVRLDAMLGLSEEQRERLTQLLLDKTRALRESETFEPRVVLAQMSRLPDDELKPLFDSRQWRLLQHQLSNARQEIPALEATGVVFKEPTTGDKP